jgi:redox-sensitive bicupin YhaK (pirin superfamily)
MSWLTDMTGQGASSPDGAVDIVVEPGVKDLGGFRVRRALPSTQRMMVGPFIFLDHMGPAVFEPGHGIDVRPHPHIGLATLTYLIEGGIRHRDTLGSVVDIAPGEVNWMTAGRGIVHSERTAPDMRATGQHMQGIQSWIALPRAHEEDAPGFFHHGAAELPHLDDTGVRLRLIVGHAYGARSPVATDWSMLYADVALDAGRALPLPDEHAERAVYVVDGEVDVAGEAYGAHRLLVFRPGDRITLRALRPSRLILLGGEPMDGPRHLWWNFVHSSKDRIESAKADWQAGRFDKVPGDEEAFIPLPE